VIVLYRLLSRLWPALLCLAALFDAKARGTRRWRREAGEPIPPKEGSGPRVWVHAASAGELEQARPLLAEIRRREPGAAILLSLASVSARGPSARVEEADSVFPLPPDTPRAMGRLMDRLRPDRVLVVKWDLWPNLLLEAERRGIPVFLLGAVLSPGSGRARPPARWLYAPLHRRLAGLSAVSDEDAAAFAELGLSSDRLSVDGDSRYDQVAARRDECRDHALRNFEATRRGRLVAGSTWPPEEDALLEAFARLRREHSPGLVLVPHELGEDRLRGIEAAAARRGLDCGRLSAGAAPEAGRVLLADVKGQLAELYRAGDLALVGGGFGAGVHSVLEPAAHGLPVLMGPRVERAVEARRLVESGGAWIFSNAAELEALWRRWLEDAVFREYAARAAREAVESGRGAAARALDFVEKRLLSADKPSAML